MVSESLPPASVASGWTMSLTTCEDGTVTMRTWRSARSNPLVYAQKSNPQASHPMRVLERKCTKFLGRCPGNRVQTMWRQSTLSSSGTSEAQFNDRGRSTFECSYTPQGSVSTLEGARQCEKRTPIILVCIDVHQIITCPALFKCRASLRLFGPLRSHLTQAFARRWFTASKLHSACLTGCPSWR